MELLGLVVFIFIIYSVMKNSFKTLGFSALETRDKTSKFTLNIFNPITHVFKILFKGFSKTGFMNEREKNKLFSTFNKGLYIDGNKLRLSQKESFNHLALISRTGGGKTTNYVIPNILKLSSEQCSMLITDISGELYELTSGYLEKQGYKIYVLDPENLEDSISYNPLYYASDTSKIDELVHTLIASSKTSNNSSSSENEFWDNGAKSLISIIIKLLLATKNHQYINLANVRYLVNNYGSDGRDLDHLVNTLADDKTYHEFRAFVKGNPSTILSMVSTANIALSPIGINENLEKLTSSHTINFDNFRKEKSVLYIKIPANKQKQYSFLQNIFYSQFFNYVMEKLPSKSDLPIYCLLDEFGNLNLPNFDTTITTIRKYNISISIILQSIEQLQNRYGKANANTILNGGIASKLFYSGADHTTTETLSQILGDITSIKTGIDGNSFFKDGKVMNPTEIRTMADDEALFIMANKLPVKIKLKAYYKDFLLKNYSKIPKAKVHTKTHENHVEYIDLDYEV